MRKEEARAWDVFIIRLHPKPSATSILFPSTSLQLFFLQEGRDNMHVLAEVLGISLTPIKNFLNSLSRFGVGKENIRFITKIGLRFKRPFAFSID